MDPGFGEITSSVPKIMLGYGNQEHFQNVAYGWVQYREEIQLVDGRGRTEQRV
jgi:hypothetical protein